MRSTANSSVATAAHAALSRALWQCCGLGLLLLVLLPSTFNPWLGSLWFWGVLAPLASLLALHRHAVLAALTEVLTRRQRRRRPHRRGPQARRLIFAPHRQRQPLRAA